MWLIDEGFGVGERYPTDEEEKSFYWDFGGHDVHLGSLTLTDERVVFLSLLKLKARALVTWSRFFLSAPFTLAGAAVGELAGVS